MKCYARLRQMRLPMAICYAASCSWREDLSSTNWRTALSIYRQQPRIRYNSTMEIGKVHDERKYQSQRQSTTPGGSEPTKAGSEKAAIAQTQRSGGSRMIKIHSAVPGGGESKKKVSRLADRLSGKKACLVVRVNHSVVSVADLSCCLV